MNSNIRSSSPNARTIRLRAQFSPLSRQPLRTSAGAAGVDRDEALHDTSAPVSDPVTPESPARALRWWDPYFLDRLQAPLTRIRE